MNSQFTNDKTDKTLRTTREKEEEDVASILSVKYNMDYIDLSSTDVDSEALRLIPEEQARATEAVAFERNGKNVSLAVHNPNNPLLKQLTDELLDRSLIIKKFLVSKKSIDRLLERYKELSFSSESKAGVFSIIDKVVSSIDEKGSSKKTIKKELDEIMLTKSSSHISNLIEIILAGAFALKASDIHFEPKEDTALMRFRIDGILSDVYTFDLQTFYKINARIKLLSGVKINISNRAQDGRFSINRSTGDIEVRVSFIPGNYGESAVLRLLDPKSTEVTLKQLGINSKLLERLQMEIRRPNGMLLTTGPTGSGKTTTLYSFLQEVYSPEVKIVTIEDPVEYHLKDIVQTQVSKNYNFADGLRSIVRQDPDIIMVGEIRDGETADIAIQAALTGHLVFSTLHTNSAAGTFPRLADLGVDSKSFGSAITVSMAQRLLRTLKPGTKKERALTDDEKKMIEKVFSTLTDKSLIPDKIETTWEPCVNEDDTGYDGRIGLYEGIFMDDELATFIRSNPPANEIATLAAKQGYLTMVQDGIIKALTGVTSISEVLSTVDLPR